MKHTIFTTGIIIIIVVIVIIWQKGLSYIQQPSRELPWNIVYVDRHNDILDVYSISPKEGNKKLLYHNSDSTNANSLFPMWSADKFRINFVAMKDGEWRKFSMKADGSDVKMESWEPDLLSRESRADDIIIENGSIFYRDTAGKKTQVYTHKLYDPKFNNGASEASWSPDKKRIIFELSGKWIYMIDVSTKEMTKIVDGSMPDWK